MCSSPRINLLYISQTLHNTRSAHYSAMTNSPGLPEN